MARLRRVSDPIAYGIAAASIVAVSALLVAPPVPLDKVALPTPSVTVCTVVESDAGIATTCER